MRFTDIVDVVYPSIDEVLEWGYVREVTYGESFERVKQFERYKDALAFFDISDKTVYQVTPKGNGLVYLLKDGGDKKRLEDSARSLVLQPAY